MIRTSLTALSSAAAIVVFTILGWATAGNAEIRAKSAGASPGKSTPKQAKPAKKGMDEATPANGSGDSTAGDPLADDDSPRSAANGKEKVKKKSSKKGAPDSKSSTGSRSGRPRKVEPPQNQQGIVAPGLDLEPET
ncbi:MAG TPA: hypothetical protein VGH74_06230 [Planctomycetaceae bacterium]|jgi:hypothetical protein